MLDKPSIIAEEEIKYLGINLKKKCAQPIRFYDKNL